MRTILSALMVSAVLLVWGLPSVPAQAEQQGKQGSLQQQGNAEARDARDDKKPTAEDLNTQPSRDLSGLKDTSHQPAASNPQNSQDSRDARDNKEAGSGTYK